MEQKTKLYIIVKIAAFLLLTWIFHFDNDRSTFIKSLNKNCYDDRKLAIGNHRLLTKYKQDKDLRNTWLKEKFPYNEINIQKDISRNEKGVNEKNKQSNRNLINKDQYYTEIIDYNNGMFDGKHFHFEKKWIKKKDYDDFVEKNSRICDIALKKVKFKSYGFGFFLFLLLFSLGIGIPVLTKLKFLESTWKFIEESELLKEACKSIKTFMENEQPYLYLVLFILLMFMVSIMFLVAIYKILRNNEKYNKIKLMT
ncbi:fam-m protein [Plasmodium brasilianum]|uniref:Fam-m protein n=1 Tax=Plasmodium brasilianum TaxID=5824 RepID=A0ACB9YFN9_PLABR|nr:fam-m protein [Plasmodium brasilianum]